jgi:CDK-activating kinase assembly factor MAT1
MSGALTLGREVQVRARIKSMCARRLAIPLPHAVAIARVASRRAFPGVPESLARASVHHRPPPPSRPSRRRYNKRQVDFTALKDYNDYLEAQEDIIFNLIEGVDVKETEARVDAYRREHASEIARLQKRNEEEDRRLASARGVAASADATWAPRRMSGADSAGEGETPAPAPGGKAASGFAAMFGFGQTPGASGGGGGGTAGGPPRVVSVKPPTPAPMSAGKALEIGHGRHAHHAGWDDATDKSEEGQRRREAAIASACGVDFVALGRRRATQEALTSVFC